MAGASTPQKSIDDVEEALKIINVKKYAINLEKYVIYVKIENIKG